MSVGPHKSSNLSPYCFKNTYASIWKYSLTFLRVKPNILQARIIFTNSYPPTGLIL